LRKLDAFEKLVFYSIIIPVVGYESVVSTYSSCSFACQVVDVGGEMMGNEIVNLGLHDFVDRVVPCGLGSVADKLTSYPKKRLQLLYIVFAFLGCLYFL